MVRGGRFVCRLSPINTVLLVFNILLLMLQFLFYNSLVSRHARYATEQLHQQQRQVSLSDAPVACPGDLTGSDEVKEMDIGLDDDLNSATRVNKSWNWNWDRRSERRPSATRFLYLVRHGQYYGMGPEVEHLSPVGKKQAKRLGERLRDLNTTFHRMVTSTSIRAVETADVIHNALPYLDIERAPLLREGWPNFPDPASPGFWDPTDPRFQTEGARLAEAFSAYIHRADHDQLRDSNELFVIHGNVIAYFILRLLQVPPERWMKISVLQGSITLVSIVPGGDVALRIIGDVGHLPKSEWTG